jgi:hypothetical protein
MSFEKLVKNLLSFHGKQVARTRLCPDDPPHQFLLTNDDSIDFLLAAFKHHDKIIVWKEEFDENDNYEKLDTDRNLWYSGIPDEMEKRMTGFWDILSPYVYKPDRQKEITYMFQEFVDAAMALKTLVPSSGDFYYSVMSLIRRDPYPEKLKGTHVVEIIDWLRINKPNGAVCKSLAEIADQKVTAEISNK